MIELKLKRNHLAVNDVSFNFLFHCLFSKITFLPIAVKLVGRKFPVVQNPFQTGIILSYVDSCTQ